MFEAEVAIGDLIRAYWTNVWKCGAPPIATFMWSHFHWMQWIGVDQLRQIAQAYPAQQPTIIVGTRGS